MTVTANQPGAVEFVYSFNGGDQLTAAAVRGVATIAYTPQTRSSHYLTVQTRSADGTLSDMAYYSFEVRS